MHTDLGAAKSTANGTVEVEMPSEQLDIDSGYDVALRNLRDRLEVPVPPVSESQQQEDYYKGVRTYMVAVWITCNAILAMAVSESYSSTHVADNFYLKFILWSVASLALFRALGSSAFGVINIISMIVEGRIQAKFEKWFGGDKDERRMGGTLAGTMSDNGKTAMTSGTESSIGSSISDAFSKISEKLSSIGTSKE